MSGTGIHALTFSATAISSHARLMASPISVLIAGHDEVTRNLERRALTQRGFELTLASSLTDALSALRARRYDTALVDCTHGVDDVWSLVDAAATRKPRVPVVLVIPAGHDELAAEALRRGVADYVEQADSFLKDLPRTIERVHRLATTEERLQLDQARLAEAQRIAQIGSWEWDVQSNVVTWSDELYRVFGRDKANFGASYQAFLDCVHPEDRADVEAAITEAMTTRQPFRNLYRVLRGGQVHWVEGRGTLTLGQDGNVLSMMGTAQDVTEREAQQAKLRESDAFFNLSLDLLNTATPDGYLLRVNPAFRGLGYSEEELLAKPFIDLVHADDVSATLAEVEKLRQGLDAHNFENRFRCKDGSYRWISWVSSAAPNGTLYGTGRDVTEQREAAQQLRAINASLMLTLKERDVLLQEVHHRVKNNLQVISSLINLQILKLDPSETRNALEHCRERVQAIALIHEKLYQSHDYARVPFADYVRSLSSSLLQLGRGGAVHLDLELSDVALPVDQAIPCGLILSELVSNALKHGFEDGRPGRIRIELSQTERKVTLAVSNDGIALPADWDRRSSQSLGLHLVSLLTDQVHGHLSVSSGAPTRFGLSFDVSE